MDGTLTARFVEKKGLLTVSVLVRMQLPAGHGST